MVEKNKSSIAWFKLSQLVSRGEKEKALGLYKLLSYSLDDKAYTLQVEGDILWAFDDPDAITKYRQAAFLYKKDQKIVSAAGIYEHLLSINREDIASIEMLLVCYARLDWYEKIEQRTDLLVELYEKGKADKDRVEKALRLACDTYRLDNKESSFKKFIIYLKAKNDDICALATAL